MRSEEIARFLPDVYQYTLTATVPGVTEPDRRLMAALAAMEVLHAPSEEVLDGLDRFVDPLRTPERFVPYLTTWVDLDWLLRPATGEDVTSESLASGVGTLRELVAAAAEFARWRGTARGLLRFLDTVTGIAGFQVEEGVTGDDRAPRPYHLRVGAPAKAKPLIERVIDAKKPAYTTSELVFAAVGPSRGPSHQEQKEEHT